MPCVQDSTTGRQTGFRIFDIQLESQIVCSHFWWSEHETDHSPSSSAKSNLLALSQYAFLA